MGQTAPPTSSPSTSYNTKRRNQKLELIEAEDEVDRQLVKYILMYDTEKLTVRQVAVREWGETSVVSFLYAYTAQRKGVKNGDLCRRVSGPDLNSHLSKVPKDQNE